MTFDKVQDLLTETLGTNAQQAAMRKRQGRSFSREEQQVIAEVLLGCIALGWFATVDDLVRVACNGCKESALSYARQILAAIERQKAAQLSDTTALLGEPM